ncbi:NfeD family protein [Posidoniimonas polymericola]|uniref:NfeD family protein n=1 Tax=Posidoniimonas polymericola TaxID=2528002 RepID=UPI0011B77A7E|nr:NfeD family protein [Posidoniimonas polymericola]
MAASLVLCLAAVGVIAFGARPVSAADDPVGALVRVRLPITGADDQTMQGVLKRAADKVVRQAADEGAGRPTLILQFDNRAAGESEFERCLSLARFLLRDMTGVKTVAYVPQTVTGHAVLVALACEEIAMAPEAELGDAAAGEDPARPIEPGMAAVYQEVAAARRNVPAAVAQGMIDRRLEVLQVEDETGVDFILSSQLDELKEQRQIVETQILSAAGAPLLLSGREARELGFAKYLVNSGSLARVLGLPERAAQEDQTTLADWKPAIIELDGELTERRLSQIKKLLGSELEQGGANWICLRINSGGGRMDRCVELAATLAELNKDDVRTVAYVPVEASGGAALVALACDQLVMHPSATLGGGLTIAKPEGGADNRKPPPPGAPQPGPPRFGGPPRGPGPAEEAQPNQLSPDQLAAALAGVRGPLAENTNHGWSLLAAMIDPGETLHVYTSRETGRQALFNDAELAEQPNSDQWRQGEQLSGPDAVLTLDAVEAEKLGVAFAVVEDYDGLKQLYGFDADPPVAKPNWALELVEALANPWLAGLLLVIGFGGVYLELNAPGLGVGGFVASVAFLLFFWSHFLSGTAEWLEVLLFVVGLFFILMEAFVLPGFGIFGLGGMAMVLASLVLVSQTFIIPKTQGQLVELRESVTLVVMSMLGCLVAAFAFRRYLPHAPGVNRMMLAPADEVELAELEHRESFADYAHLVGQAGVAATNLIPSGKAEFGGELLDVIADGQVIDRGEAIVVTKAKGSRVLVQKKR